MIMNRAELDKYLANNIVYTGEYLETMSAKDFATANTATRKAVAEMTKLGRSEMGMKRSLEKLEAQAKSLGYGVAYDVNPKTNTVEVVLLKDKDISKVGVEEAKKIKAEMPTFKISVGTAKRGTKSGMAAPKSYAPHITNAGTVLVTQVEESIAAVTNTLTELKNKGAYAKKPEYVKSKVKAAQRESEKSIVTTEGYSMVDMDEWLNELNKETSNARDTFVRTALRIAGITGEVAKKGGFVDKIKKAQKLTKKQTEQYNQKVDKLLTEYAVIYTQLGEQAADEYFKQSKTLKELGITDEKEIQQRIKQVKDLFGNFLKMRSTSGLGSDETLRAKKLSFVGDRDLAFRGLVKTGRHSTQGRGYLERSEKAKQRAGKRRSEIFIPKVDKDDFGYYTESGHQLYSRGLISDEKLVNEAYNKAINEGIEDAINKRLSKLRQGKKYQRSSIEQRQKMEQEASERVRASLMATLPLTAPSIMEDMGIMSESTAKEFESLRKATATLTDKEYGKLEAQAVENYEKFSDKTKGKITKDEYIERYVAKKALGRKGLVPSSIDISTDADGNFFLQAREKVGSGTAKILSRYTGLRETEKAIPDWVFDRMTENLGVAGADIISLAKKFKAEEIPGAIQGFLSYAISAGKATSEQVAKDLKKLGFDTEVDAQGHIFIDNSDEAVKDVDWNSVLLYLNKLGILEQAAEGDFKFKEGAVLSDVMNRADTWDVDKGVKVGYKESAGVKRDIAIAASQTGKDYSDFEKDIDKIFDPTFGGRGEIAEKARRDREAILDITSGSIVKTYKSQIASSREADVEKLKKSSYKGRTRKGKRKYIISVGNGSGYTIDVNQLLNEAIDYTEGGGSLTPEEYGKTVLGAIDAVKTKILSKIPDAEIDVAIDPGTDFGFGMSFGEGGVEEGATGRFVYLPNVETDVRFDGKGNGLYDLPEYATALHSLIGSMKVGGIGASEKAQELTKGIFTTAHSSKGTLYERAFTKRIGPSHGGHITAMSRVGIDDLLRQSEAARLAGDETTAKALDERARRLMSSVWVSQEVATNLLRNREQFTNAGGKYDVGAHGEAVFSALRYLRGDDAATAAMHAGFKTLSEEDQVKTINDLIPEIVSLITEQPGEAGMKRGLIGMLNRFPSISKHPEVFGEMLVSGGLKGFDMEIGPALAKFLNGDYDGDTAYLILGLWSSGMSFDAAAEMVERQKDINKHVYQTMLNKTEGDTTAAESGEIGKISDPARMGLSALATKFNKPYTGMFSNMSTRIREGLRATGYDYIDEQGRPNFNLTGDNLSDYIAAIQGELVTTVGQILEQDSISAKKVDKRIEKMRASIGRELKPEEVDKIEQEVLHEFEELDAMLRNPDFSYEQIIERMKEMGLFADEATQITATLTGQIKSLTSKLSPEQQEAIYKKLGLSTADIEKGIVNPEAFKMAGASIERELSSREGKDIRIFAGEYGTGFATSRKYTESMKDDTYELLRYVKQLNGALKQTGEIIDENGNKFSEYGEKIKGAKTSLQAEAGQESAKIVIAGKEGKAIDRNADSYKNLADKLEKAGGNYKEINRLSTSELKSRLLPYAGQQTTGLDPKTLSKLSRKARRGEVLSKEELAAAFGVKDEAALNSLFMNALSTRRGEYVHNLAQGDKTGARAKKKEITDLFKVFGYSDEQIQDTFGIYNLGAKNVKSITKKFGTSMGAEIPFIGMTSDGQYVINARSDELFYKQRISPWDKTKKEDVITLVDYKTHTGGKISDEDIAQGIIYKTFLEEFRDFAKNLGKSISDEDAAEMFRKQIGQGMKYTSDTEERQKLLSRVTPELVGRLRGGAAIETSIVVVDSATGAAQAYAIGQDRDKYKQISNMLLSGDTSPLTTEQKTVLKGGAKQLTSADYFKPGVSVEERKSIESQAKSAVSNEQRNESQKEYNTLVSEEFKLKKEIAALDKERWKLTDIEGKKSTDYTVQNLDAEKQWRQDELKRMQDRKAELEGLGAVESKATTASNEEKMTAYLTRLGVGADGEMALTPEEQADYWSQYERALDKQARAEEEVFGIRNKAQTSYGTEKNLLYQIADEKAKGLATSQAELDNLEKIVSGLGKEAQARVQSLKGQVALNQQLYKLQALKQTRGATSIWDVMANDIRRATMRVADFGVAAKILNKIPQDIQKVIQYTKELDAAMTNIRVVTGASAEEAQTLARGYTQLAKELGITTVEVANSANEWARQGYEAEQANQLIIASSKLAKLGMISTTEATKDLTSAIKGFKLSTEDAMSVVDKLTKVDQVAAISAGNLAEGLARVATTAQQAGLSLDETAAMVTTITEVTQRDASTAGEALRTLISRYSNVKAGVFTDMSDSAEETSGNINDIEKVLSKLGIRIRTSGTEMRSIEDVLDELAEKWNTLDDVSRNAVASAFAGKMTYARNYGNIIC